MKTLLLAFLLAPIALHAAERVLHFQSELSIAQDGELTVRERIAVLAEGRSIRRGILRDFPTDYRDRYGNAVNVPFSVLGVTRDGIREKFSLERLANGTRIRIGDAGVLLRPGRHEYEIRYRTARQVGFFRDHDELYWNVNGNGWTFAFDRIDADVQLPAPVPADRLELEAYTGPAGARGRDYVSEAGEGRASFRSTGAFAPREGMTIVVSFPKGIVTPPGALQKAKWFFASNPGTAAGVAGYLLLLSFLWWRWMLVGRDPRAGPKFPRYQAPPGVGPAGARYVDRMAFDDKCLAAALLGLGQRGYLAVRQVGDGYDLTRTGKSVEWLPGEAALARGIFAGGAPRISLDRTHNPAVQAARDDFHRTLAVHFEGKLFSKNWGSLALGIFIAACALGAAFFLDAPLLATLVLGAVMVVTLVLFARWLPAYSVEGRRIEDAIVGLRQYLSIAEADDLRRFKAPPQTREEFAKFLPYAVALDVEKTWANRFARILGAAAVAAAVAEYYSSASGGFSDPGFSRFSDSVSGLGDTISAAATPPGSTSGGSDGGSSSSGDSGGSSGGGGGGGGGSGW